MELETELNKLKMTQHTEHLRATTLAQKNVEAEANVRQVQHLSMPMPLYLGHNGPVD